MTYLLFVVLATIIWYGRALRAQHETTVPVRVQYMGVPSEVITSEPLPQTIEVTLRDAGTRLRVYRREPLQISIDLTGRFTSQSGELRISSDLFRTAVSRQLQGTTALQSLKPEQVHTTYYTQHRRRVPVMLHHSVKCAVGFQLCREPQLQHQSIMVYGTSQALDTLEQIETQLLLLREVCDSAVYTVGLIAPRGVRLEQQTVQVGIAAERFTERSVELPLQVERLPEDKKIRLFPDKVRVTMHVGVSHWKQVTDSDITAVCVYRDSVDLLPVELRSNNPYVSEMRSIPSRVEFLIEK